MQIRNKQCSTHPGQVGPDAAGNMNKFVNTKNAPPLVPSVSSQNAQPLMGLYLLKKTKNKYLAFPFNLNTSVSVENRHGKVQKD